MRVKITIPAKAYELVINSKKKLTDEEIDRRVLSDICANISFVWKKISE